VEYSRYAIQPEFATHETERSERRRFDTQQCTVVLVGDHVEQAVGPLPHVANPLMQVAEQPLAAQLLELVVEHDALEAARARNLADARAADEQVTFPRGKSIAGVERQAGRCDRRQPKNERLLRWLDLAEERVAFQGLPARICWLGYGERAKAGLRFNEMVASGELSAPIVIGRDHLDSGSVASPYRETEAMKDGSDAIADWPILNALVNTAAGAHWVSVHHGGGVGIGYSIHAGMVVVADGTENSAARLERVLTSDPGMGVVRHADAGYDEAIAVAAERGVRLPWRE